MAGLKTNPGEYNMTALTEARGYQLDGPRGITEQSPLKPLKEIDMFICDDCMTLDVKFVEELE